MYNQYRKLIYHSDTFTFVEETAKQKGKSHNRHAVWQVEEEDQGGIREVKHFGSSCLNDDDSDCESNSKEDNSFEKPGEPVNKGTKSHHP